MGRFTVESLTREGETLHALRDQASGAEVVVWPSLGANCLAARLPGSDGQLVDLLLAPPTLAALREQPSHWGIPLLFPFPSRIPRGAYTFQERALTFTRDFHGFVIDRPWSVAGTVADETRAALRCRFDPSGHADTHAGYPFPFLLEVTYTLDPDGLSLHVQVTNTGRGRLPFGFGAHPYLRLPLGRAGDPGECDIRVPAARRWHLPSVHAVSDGVVAPWETLCPPVGQDDDLRRPKRLGETRYDGVYTALSLTEGLVECAARDPVSRLEAVVRATPSYANVTVFRPAWGPGLCFEPWTCPPNGFNLAAHDVPGHGLVVLEPDERWQGTIWLFLRAALSAG